VALGHTNKSIMITSL